MERKPAPALSSTGVPSAPPVGRPENVSEPVPKISPETWNHGKSSHQQPVPAFDPTNEEISLQRAGSIASSLSKRLALPRGHSLGRPQFRGSMLSAHVTFQYLIDGVPVRPYGNVAIDLGREGQVNGIYSTLGPALQVVNVLTLTIDTARTRALKVFADWFGFPAVQGDVKGGDHVIWIAAPASQEGRHAFDYFIKGIEIVIDAASGEILYSSRQRQ